MILQWFIPAKCQNPLWEMEMNSLERTASRKILIFFFLGHNSRITKTNTVILIKETVEEPWENWSTNQLLIATRQHWDGEPGEIQTHTSISLRNCYHESKIICAQFEGCHRHWHRHFPQGCSVGHITSLKLKSVPSAKSSPACFYLPWVRKASFLGFGVFLSLASLIFKFYLLFLLFLSKCQKLTYGLVLPSLYQCHSKVICESPAE